MFLQLFRQFYPKTIDTVEYCTCIKCNIFSHGCYYYYIVYNTINGTIINGFPVKLQTNLQSVNLNYYRLSSTSHDCITLVW